jgi:hypothetical protein
MFDTTLIVVLVVVTFFTIAMLMVASLRPIEVGETRVDLARPIDLVAKGFLRIIAWFATGLATYGLVFGYTGASGSVLMDSSRHEGPAAGGSAERGIGSVRAQTSRRILSRE